MRSPESLVGKVCPSCSQTIEAEDLKVTDDGHVFHETQEDEWGGHIFEPSDIDQRDEAWPMTRGGN